MFGDLEKLLRSSLMAEVDVFTAHDTRIVGHFTILRNNDLVNRIGFEIENWQSMCLDLQTKQVDELFFQGALEAHPEIRWAAVLLAC